MDTVKQTLDTVKRILDTVKRILDTNMFSIWKYLEIRYRTSDHTPGPTELEDGDFSNNTCKFISIIHHSIIIYSLTNI